MRLTFLALAAAVTLAGCGGDEPDQPEAMTPRPAPEGPPADTTVGDTVAVPDSAMARSGAEADRDPTDAPGAAPAAGETGAAASPRQRLYTVQVAAFTESATAVEWARRLRSQDLPVWTSMEELGGRTFYRLRVGASPSVSEARRLASMLSARYEWPVWVAPVTPADRVPEGAVERTRRMVQGG